MEKLHKYKVMTDEEVVNAYRLSSDQQLVGELFERYSHLVFGVCLKYLKNRDESKDMVITIFEKLMNDLKNFNVQNFRPWLHTVTRNHCLMFLRKVNRPGTEKDIETLSYKLKESEEELKEKNENEIQLTQLEESIKELNEEQRICITLFYLESKSYQEVSAITGWDMNKVKSYIQNGKRNLKNLILSKNETE